MDSANKDCALSQNNFGTSERDFRLSNGSDDDYFGYAKIASYRLDNASSGYAYFKVRIGQDSNRMTEQPSTDSFETNQAIDFGDDGIAKNLYWKYGAGCSVDSTRGYRVTGKSSCWINVYARSDPSWPTSI